MALTVHRWTLCLFLASAVIAAAYLPPSDITERSSLSLRYWSMAMGNGVGPTRRWRLGVAADRWMALAELEEVRRALPPPEAPWVVPRDGLRPEVTAALDSMVRRLWRSAPRSDSAIRLRVIATPEGPAVNLLSATERPQVLLPEMTDGHTCLVLIPGLPPFTNLSSGELPWWKRILRQTVTRAIAPCILRAVFGSPGLEVGRWLASRNYDLAASLAWAAGGNAWLEPDPWRFEAADREEGAMPALLQRILGVLPAPYEYSTRAAGCAGGRSEACTALIVPTVSGSAVTGPIRLASSFMDRRRRALSRFDARLISDLIEERGPESFRRFWTSRLPVQAAFAEVYGEPIGGWVGNWVARRQGRIELGAPVHPTGTLLGLLAGLLAVAVAAGAAGGREVS